MKTIILCVLLLALSLLGADGQLTKTPYESLDLSLDFAARAPNGVTLTSVTAKNFNTGTDDTTGVIVLAPATPVPAVVPGTSKVIFRVFGGVNGQTEYLSIKAVRLDTGEKLEAIIIMTVVSSR